MITLTIKGVPPSLNRFLGRGNEWEYRKAKKEWTELVIWAIKALPGKLQHPYDFAEVHISYFFPDDRRHDADNYCGKLLLDGMTRGGVIKDDDFKHISLSVSGTTDRKNPRTEITVRGYERWIN